jgi:hypothetical protein
LDVCLPPKHNIKKQDLTLEAAVGVTLEAAVGEPYSRGQWDSALKATPHSPKGDIW